MRHTAALAREASEQAAVERVLARRRAVGIGAALAAAHEAREQLLAALDHLDDALQEAKADVHMGGIPDPGLLSRLAETVRDRRNVLYMTLRVVGEIDPETGAERWAESLRRRAARKGVN